MRRGCEFVLIELNPTYVVAKYLNSPGVLWKKLLMVKDCETV